MSWICPRDCPGRSATCHGECESYLSAYAENRVRNRKRRMESESKHLLSESYRKNLKRLKLPKK